jgi:hypothetical protein
MQEQSLIPTGWYLLKEDPVLSGDRYWDVQRSAWLPITVNSFTDLAAYQAVIRKGK